MAVRDPVALEEQNAGPGMARAPEKQGKDPQQPCPIPPVIHSLNPGSWATRNALLRSYFYHEQVVGKPIKTGARAFRSQGWALHRKWEDL